MSALEKALITNTITSDRIPVQFNPEEYTLQRENRFAPAVVPGLSAPLLQFANGELQTLEMELLIDTLEAHNLPGGGGNAAGEDVRKLVRKVTDLMNIEPTTHAPPVLLFTWGSLTFTCVLTRASQRYVMFLQDGTPVRARVQVAFQEFKNAELEAKEIKRETADYTRTYVVGDADTLSAIASRVYENPAVWRPIAIRNRIDDPSALRTGQRLSIPLLPFTDPESGEVMR